MAGAKTLEVSIMHQNGTLFTGQCQALFVPSGKEEVAILPLHTPLIMLLNRGEVSVVVDGSKRVISKVSDGLVYVGENRASVLINRDEV